MKIFVANLNYNTSEETVRHVFEEFGEVESAKIIMDKFTGRSKGFGFIEMPSDEAGQEAINTLNESDLDDRTIVVKVAAPREDRGGRGGGYNRGGGGGGDRRGGGGYGGGGGDRDRRY